MRLMDKWTTIVVMTGIILMTSGCASYLSYQASKEEIYKKRVYASGNQDAIRSVQAGISAENAIRAVPIGNQGIGIAIDLAALDIIKEHPFRSLGALVLDAGIMYGAYRGVDSINNDDDKDSSSSGSGTTVTIQNSDGNTVNVVNGDNNGGNQNPNDGQNTTGNSGGSSGASASPSTTTSTETETSTTSN